MVPALIEALRDAEWMVRHHAAEALGRIGPGARAAIPALTQALEDPEPYIQQTARAVLRDIRTGSEAPSGQ